jgi:DNA-binding MarR family transcriptional regulator
VSRAVALLERRKLISRRTTAPTGAEAFLSLTLAGHETYNDLAPTASDFAQRLMETVDPAERSAKLAGDIANHRAPR